MTVNALSFVASSIILNKMDMVMWFGLCHYITYTEHEDLTHKIKKIENEINSKKK